MSCKKTKIHFFHFKQNRLFIGQRVLAKINLLFDMLSMLLLIKNQCNLYLVFDCVIFVYFLKIIVKLYLCLEKDSEDNESSDDQNDSKAKKEKKNPHQS